MLKRFITNIKRAPIVKKNPILVIEICKFHIIGKSKLNKSFISNWLKGLSITVHDCKNISWLKVLIFVL